MKTDGTRRPVSGRDAVRSQIIDVLKAQLKGENVLAVFLVAKCLAIAVFNTLKIDNPAIVSLVPMA